jgi:hypothetical protein
VEDASKRHQHLELTERDELDEALNHYDAPSLDSIRAALRAGIKRPQTTPRKDDLFAGLHRGTSKMSNEATSAMASIFNTLTSFFRGKPRSAKLGAGSYDALPFDPESKFGGVIIALLLVGLTALVYYVLNQLHQAAERFMRDGPPQDIPFGPELRSLIQEGKFLETPLWTWVTEMLPLAYVTVLPLLLGLRAALGCGGAAAEVDLFNAMKPKPPRNKPRAGQRVLRRILMGSRAIQRMHARKAGETSFIATPCRLIVWLAAIAAIAFALLKDDFKILGMRPVTFLVDMVPLLYVSLLPLLLGLRAAVGLLVCGRRGAITPAEEEGGLSKSRNAKPRAGQRVIRRVNLGMRAINNIRSSGFSMRLAREEEEVMRQGASYPMGSMSA